VPRAGLYESWVTRFPSMFERWTAAGALAMMSVVLSSWFGVPENTSAPAARRARSPSQQGLADDTARTTPHPRSADRRAPTDPLS